MVTNLMKYNPAFLGDEALIRSFVARTSEFERIMEVLRENTTGSNQHLLVIGPRGIGKTTLVLRTAAEVRADPALGADWYPVVYGEETYEVSSAGEFWLEALFHVGQQTGDARWQQAYEELLGEHNEERLRPRALAQLMDFADEQGKRMVLVVENMNMLFGGQVGDEDAWVLRHTLMNEPRIMLIGTATSRFRVMDEYNQALYELFRILELEPLADEEAQAVWTAATGQTAPLHQLRPIQILTGGNPRLIRILSEFAAKTSFRSLMDDLTRLVDEHTEYFKHHLDNLPPQERKVFVVLADLWDPSTARQVADASRLDVNVASAQLKRLVDRGAVTTPYRHGRTQFYQVAERMYNIYHLMRRRGQPSSRVHAVVRFMVSLYRDEELIRTTQSLAEEAAKLTADQRREHFVAYEAILTHTREPRIAKQIVEAGRLVFQAMPDAPEPLLRLLAPKPPTSDYRSSHLKPRVGEDSVWSALDASDRGVTGAEATLRRALENDPKNEEAWYELGLLLANQPNRVEEALVVFDHLLVLDETVANAWSNKATALRQLGRAKESLYAYERALTLDAANRVAWAGKAAVLTDLGRTAEALEAIDRVVTLDPGIPWAWAARGVALSHLGRFDEALADLDRAIALDPEFTDAWYSRGSVLRSLGRTLEAIESYDRTLRLNPDHATAWAGRGAALLVVHRAGEALESLNRALSLDPGAAATYHNQGFALSQLGHAEEALESYERALSLDAEEAATWHNKGSVLLELGRAGEALNAFERGLSLNADDAGSWINKAAALGHLGRFEEALNAYDRALALDATSAIAWTGRGGALGQLGRVEEALQALERALALDEHNADAWSNVGTLNGRVDRPEKALEAYDRAVALAPRHAIAWMGRGEALRELGRADEALQAYEHAVQHDPANAAAWSQRGDVLLQVGRTDEALESYDRALALEPGVAAWWVDRGFALLTLGRANAARASFERSLAILPEVARAYLGRGLAERDLRRQREAGKDLRHAVMLGSLAPSVENGIIRILLEDLRLPDDALAAARELAGRAGASSDTLIALALEFLTYGRRDDVRHAEAWARSAVEQAPGLGAARYVLACTLGMQGKWQDALEQAELFLRDDALLTQGLDDVIEFFIGAAASGHGSDVLSLIETAGTAETFEPLVVAIRRLAGEPVDVAREIMEISTDVIRRIEERAGDLTET